MQRIPKFLEQVIEPLEPLQVHGQPVFSLWMKPTNKIRFYVAANTESEFIAGFVSGDTRGASRVEMAHEPRGCVALFSTDPSASVAEVLGVAADHDDRPEFVTPSNSHDRRSTARRLRGHPVYEHWYTEDHRFLA